MNTRLSSRSLSGVALSVGVVVFGGMLGIVPVRAVHAQEVPQILDTDGDGIRDVWEVQVFHTDPLKRDTDADGFDDREEIEKGFNPLGKGALVETDTDQDGLSDRLELAFGADPLNADTDGDTYADGKEVMSAFSPTSTDPTLLPKVIRINIAKQELTQNVMGIAVKTHRVSTGLPSTPTPVGTFKVLQKHPRAWSHAGKLWMPYWMHFSGRGHGIHSKWSGFLTIRAV